MKNLRLIQFAIIAFAVVVSFISTAAAQDRPPNIVVFFIDDLGWRDVGFMGSDFYETPNVDRIARQGMVFTDAYSCGPNCAPSRAGLMSGQYSPRHGVFTVGDPVRGRHKFRKLEPIANKTVLRDDIVTLGETLRRAGYTTATMGKWHLGPDPTTQGFDLNVGGNTTGSPRGGYFGPFKQNPQMKEVKNVKKGDHLTDVLAREACRFVETNKAKPFFLYFTMYSVHTPLQAKQDLIEKYRAKPGGELHHQPTYAAMIETMDDAVGRVLDKLDELDLAKNTIVLFHSDNGGYGRATSMKPLRGSKGMLYEGGIRVPLAVRWPGVVEPGSKTAEPVIGLDIYPTFIDIAGAKRPADHPLDGESFLPVLKSPDAKLKRDALYWHFPCYLQSYATAMGPFRQTPATAIRAGDWKLIESFEDGTLELYNLKDDISEQNNLADTNEAKRKELHAKLVEWRLQMNAPVPFEKNPKYDPEAVWGGANKGKAGK